MKNSLSAKGQAGFTLVELVVVMAVFIIVIMIATDSFNKILINCGILSQRAESNIEGVAGLEMLRHDLTQAGFGLPCSFAHSTPPTYNEAAAAPGSNYNDSPNGIPRALVAGNNLAASTGVLDGTDLLVVKGTSLARSTVSQQWTYVNYSSSGSTPPRTWASNNMVNNQDRVIVLRRRFTDSGTENQLVYDESAPTQFYTIFSDQGFGTGQTAFAPAIEQETNFLYGVTSAQNPRMPFNRTDFYVKRPAAGLPSGCADHTGFLYQATLNHSDGSFTETPILACVADMQVVFGWDMDDDGVIESYSNADGTTVNGWAAADVQNLINNANLSADQAATFRSRLKMVKVYLLAQDGTRDRNYRNSNPIVVGNRDNGETSLTREWTVAAINTNNWTNYRWKVYRIVLTPNNLTFK